MHHSRQTEDFQACLFIHSGLFAFFQNQAELPLFQFEDSEEEGWVIFMQTVNIFHELFYKILHSCLNKRRDLLEFSVKFEVTYLLARNFCCYSAQVILRDPSTRLIKKQLRVIKLSSFLPITIIRQQRENTRQWWSDNATDVWSQAESLHLFPHLLMTQKLCISKASGTMFER